MNSRTLLDKLSTNLGLISSKIEIENANNNQSLNILFETPFLEILNKIFEYNLINTNKLSSNFPGIDGIDLEKKVMVQVTSTFSIDKIKSTIETIIKEKYYLKADKLYFVFLKPKKKILKNSKEELIKLIDNKFKFSFEESILDLKDINKILSNELEFNLIFEINKLLESILFDIDINSKNSFDYIAVSFDDEEIDNAFAISSMIAKMGYNIVVDSEKLRQKFIVDNSRFIDNLIVLKETSRLDFIDNLIVVVSPKHIKSSIDNDSPKCRIFEYALENEIRPLLLNFSEFSESILHKKFKNPRSATTANSVKIEKLISDYLKPKKNLKYSFDEIEKVLTSLFPTHTFKKFESDKLLCVFNFTYENSAINFLIFSHDFKRNEVFNKFDLEFSKGYSTNLSILVPKDYNQTTDLRIKHVQEKYKNHKVYFLHEYLYDKSLKAINSSQEKRLHENVFIQPFFELDKDKETLDDIFDWLKNDESSVAFIVGGGGDGKTTVCEKIHDEIIDEFENQIVIFLDAQTYIESIKKRELNDSWKFDLQTVFEISNKQVNGVDLNTFKSNFTFGNITVIIDGIDEIISTLPNFSLIDFLEDFNQLEETIGRGKIIISCRDIYIQELLKTDHEILKRYKFYHLLKFNRPLAEKYFNKHFNTNSISVKNSLRLLDDFYKNISSKGFIYSPFVLEIISIIVENDFEYDEIEFDFNSNILLKTNSNDYLIYKIIEREIAKKERHGFVINPDQYIRLLGLIAIEKNGMISKEDFNHLLKKLSIDLNSEKVQSSLKDNPFFHYENEKYHFRFDFYNAVFKYNAIYSKLSNSSSFTITDSFITVLSEEFVYNSALFEGLKEKIKSSELSFDNLLDKFLKLKIEINNFNLNNEVGYTHLRQKAISNLIIFLIDFNENKQDSSQIIIKLFNDEDFSNQDLISIKNLYLIDVPETVKLLLDFSNLYFSDSVIENYNGFLNCTFNEYSFFDNSCKISKVNNDSLNFKKCSVRKENFHDGIFTSDNSLYKMISLIESGGEDIMGYFRKYFRAFHKGSKLSEKISINELPKINYHSLTLSDINAVLLENDILKIVNKDEIVLNLEKKTKIIKLINQNISFTELLKVRKEIEKIVINGKA